MPGVPDHGASGIFISATIQMLIGVSVRGSAVPCWRDQARLVLIWQVGAGSWETQANERSEDSRIRNSGMSHNAGRLERVAGIEPA